MGSMTQEQYWAAEFRKAAELLLDPNLIWSADFEAVREPLGRYLNRASREEIKDIYLVRLVQEINKGA